MFIIFFLVFLFANKLSVFASVKIDSVGLLNLEELSSKLTIPENLDNLTAQNQVGLVMLKVVEIIGEDNIRDLDPETIYFINRILNELNLKKIRNNILSESLPVRV